MLFYKDCFFLQHIHIYIYIYYFFFSELPFYGNHSTLDSHANTVISHAARRLPKPWQGLLFLACLGGVRKGGERNLCAGEFPTIPLITHAVQANLFFFCLERENRFPGFQRIFFFLSILMIRGEAASNRQTVSTVYFILGILRTGLWSQGREQADRSAKFT